MHGEKSRNPHRRLSITRSIIPIWNIPEADISWPHGYQENNLLRPVQNDHPKPKGGPTQTRVDTVRGRQTLRRWSIVYFQNRVRPVSPRHSPVTGIRKTL